MSRQESPSLVWVQEISRVKLMPRSQEAPDGAARLEWLARSMSR